MPLHTLRVCPFGADYYQHHHAHHQIVIGIHGHARMDIGTQTFYLSVNAGCILSAGTPHGFQGLGENQLLVVDVPTNAALLATEFASLFRQSRVFDVDNGLAHYVAFLCHDIKRHDVVASNSLLTTLVGALAARLSLPRLLPRLNLNHLNTFIGAHLDQSIRVAQLAALYHLSAAHFTALFRQQCQTSPYRYVQTRRMQKAWQLVQQSTLSLDHIAASTHFADQSALTHAFRRHFNLTPRDLRHRTLVQCNGRTH